MYTRSEFLVNKIYEKLRNYKHKKIKLEKEEFQKFIFFLINED